MRTCVVVLALLSACASTQRLPPREERAVERGLASRYADGLAGRRTASGETYSPRADTCAHRWHVFGTRLIVTAVASGRRTTCRVNDRGPFVKGRIVDLSRAVAERLGMFQGGLLEVEVRTEPP